MILDTYDNKISAYKKAKKLIRSCLQSAYFSLEKDPEDTNKMTEKEQEEVMKYIDKIVIRIERKMLK